ncbi:hypothetical protein EMMF5_002287 [Cystobasidiomycetes sp. EMM_F5]
MGGESQRATSSGLNALQLSPASQQPVRLETAEFLASLGQPVASTSHTDAVHFSTASSHIFGQNSLPRDLETSSRELDGPTRACSPTPLAAGPEQGLDSVMPFPSILAVVDLFFTTLWHRLPILHRPSLASRLASRHDRIDPAFYSLVANICAATCVSSRSLPLLPILAACGCSTWLDAGKRFNSATMATGHRIHQLAKAGSTTCLIEHCYARLTAASKVIRDPFNYHEAQVAIQALESIAARTSMFAAPALHSDREPSSQSVPDQLVHSGVTAPSDGLGNAIEALPVSWPLEQTWIDSTGA